MTTPIPGCPESVMTEAKPDPNLLNEVARKIDEAAFDRFQTSLYDHSGVPWDERRRNALSKASQVLVLVEGWSNSAQSQPSDRRADALSVGLDAEPSAEELMAALRAPSFRQDSKWHVPPFNYTTKPRALLEAAADAIQALTAPETAL